MPGAYGGGVHHQRTGSGPQKLESPPKPREPVNRSGGKKKDLETFLAETREVNTLSSETVNNTEMEKIDKEFLSEMLNTLNLCAGRLQNVIEQLVSNPEKGEKYMESAMGVNDDCNTNITNIKALLEGRPIPIKQRMPDVVAVEGREKGHKSNRSSRSNNSSKEEHKRAARGTTHSKYNTKIEHRPPMSPSQPTKSAQKPLKASDPENKMRSERGSGVSGKMQTRSPKPIDLMDLDPDLIEEEEPSANIIGESKIGAANTIMSTNFGATPQKPVVGGGGGANTQNIGDPMEYNREVHGEAPRSSTKADNKSSPSTKPSGAFFPTHHPPTPTPEENKFENVFGREEKGDGSKSRSSAAWEAEGFNSMKSDPWAFGATPTNAQSNQPPSVFMSYQPSSATAFGGGFDFFQQPPTTPPSSNTHFDMQMGSPTSTNKLSEKSTPQRPPAFMPAPKMNSQARSSPSDDFGLGDSPRIPSEESAKNVTETVPGMGFSFGHPPPRNKETIPPIKEENKDIGSVFGATTFTRQEVEEMAWDQVYIYIY